MRYEYISWDALKEIWYQTSNYSWRAFIQALNYHAQKIQSVEEEILALMTKIAIKLERQGEEFPRKPEDLFSVLNRQTA